MNFAQAFAMLAAGVSPGLPLNLPLGWPAYVAPVCVRTDAARDELHELVEQVVNDHGGLHGLAVRDLRGYTALRTYSEEQVAQAVARLAGTKRIKRSGSRNHYRYSRRNG